VYTLELNSHASQFEPAHLPPAPKASSRAAVPVLSKTVGGVNIKAHDSAVVSAGSPVTREPSKLTKHAETITATEPPAVSSATHPQANAVVAPIAPSAPGRQFPEAAVVILQDTIPTSAVAPLNQKIPSTKTAAASKPAAEEVSSSRQEEPGDAGASAKRIKAANKIEDSRLPLAKAVDAPQSLAGQSQASRQQESKLSKKRKMEADDDVDNEDNYPQVLTEDGWIKVRTGLDRFNSTRVKPEPVKYEDSEEFVPPEPCETIEMPLLRRDVVETMDRSVAKSNSSSSSSSGRGFKRFKKNLVRHADKREVVVVARMEKVFPKESEREIQVCLHAKHCLQVYRSHFVWLCFTAATGILRGRR
jgi:hypothetical protein